MTKIQNPTRRACALPAMLAPVAAGRIRNLYMILKKEHFNLLKLPGLFVKTLPKTIANIPARHLPARALHWQAGCQALAGGEDGKQLIKASGSVSAKLQTCFGH
ncbi:hypothetical protein J7L85_04490 [candidate division WOR-3 bacterium]|nr:hypothetical protein [candidate division WOR-3 bacterium]